MANRFCVGATTNTTASWSDTSGGASGFSIPVASDDVFFDVNSPSCRMDANFFCRSINFTGYINTFTRGLGFSNTIGDATAGAGNIALKFSSTMTYILEDATSSITFVSTSATVQDVDFKSKITGNIEFNAASNGSWKYISTQNGTSTTTVKHTKGTLNLNGQTLNIAAFTSTNSNTRSIDFTGSVLNLTGVGNTFLDCGVVSFLTVINTGSGSTVIINRNILDASQNAPLLFMGIKVWNMDVTWNGGGTMTIRGGVGSTYKKLTFNGAPFVLAGNEDRVQVNESCIVTDTVNGINANGYSASRRLRVHSNSGTSLRTFTVANATTVTGRYVDFLAIAFTVTNDLSAITGGAGDLGYNSGIIFTTGITCYFYAPSTGVKLWNDPQYWFLGSGGTGGLARPPIPADSPRFDVNSFPVSGVTVRCGIGSERLGKNVDWTGALNTPTWDFQVDVTNYGNLTLIPGMALTAYSAAFYNMNGTGTGNTFTLTTGGQVFPHTQFQFNMASTNTYQLGDDFNGNVLNTTLFYLFSGIFNSNSKNVTAGRFIFDTNSVTLGTSIFTATILTGTPFNITSFATTYSCASAEFRVTGTGTGAKSITGSATSRVHGKLTISGAGDCTYTFSGTNTFGDTVFKATKHTLACTTGTTTTFTGTITCVGSAGNYITLRSTTSTAFTWSKTSGTVNCNYLILSKSTAAGGATFNAGANTIDGGGNTGWTGLVTEPFTWIGAFNNDFTNALNWQGLVAPGIGNIVYFTGVSVVNCTINAAASCKGINIGLAYTGIITQSASLTVDTEGIEQYGGTFTGGAFAISNAGRFKRVAGVWTNNSGTFSQTAQGTGVDTWNDAGGTFSANSGTVEIIGSLDAVITNAAARQFFHLTYNTSGQVSGTHFADGNFTRLQGAIFNSDISIKGNYLGSLIGGDVGAGTGILRLINTAGQSLTYPKTAALQLNVTGTITLNNDIEVNGTFTHTASVTVNGFKFVLKGNMSLADTSTSGTTTTEIGGVTPEQTITGVGVLVGNIVINKDAGFVKQLANMQPTDTSKTLTITKGQWATNNYSLTCVSTLTISTSGALNKTPLSSIYALSTSGQITAKKSTYQEIFI